MPNSPTAKSEKAGKTVALSFTSPEELSLHEALSSAALADDRSINSFIVRVLLGKESFSNISE